MRMNVTLAIVMARAWWTFILRGVIAILFGLVCLLFPPLAIIGLATLFGFWLIMDGVSGLTGAWSAPGWGGWWISLLEGIAGLVGGCLPVLRPVISSYVLVRRRGTWAL